jgi:putative chitinase
MATFEQALFQLWPHGDSIIPGLRASIVTSAPKILEKYAINTKTAFAHFMAQISHECGAGLEVEENLSYSAERMTQVWPSRFHSIEEAAPYAHNPRMLANKVYNGRMGNEIGSDDGYNYRGRGATQTTGRNGYKKLGEKLGIDLLGNPGMVNEPGLFLECGAADFVLCGCLMPALSDDIRQVTLKLNGGEIGLDQREVWLNRWKSLNVILPIGQSTSSVPNVVPLRPKPVRVPARAQKSWIEVLIAAIMSLFGGKK